MAEHGLADPANLSALSRRLRARRTKLSGGSPGLLQERALHALCTTARGLLGKQEGGFAGRCPDSDPRGEANWISLKALLQSWNENDLRALIASEGVLAPVGGPCLTLHVLATNTPLLAWTSIARALLVESASIVRLPENAPEVYLWSERFHRALCDADPRLAGLVELTHWDSSDLLTTRAALQLADSALVYGGDSTIQSLDAIGSETGCKVIGFGARISFGIVTAGADLEKAARGSAVDIAILDQQGCLSPQFIFVQDVGQNVDRFSQSLASELGRVSRFFPSRSDDDAARIREAIAMAQMGRRTAVLADPALLWTIAIGIPSQGSLVSVPGMVRIVPIMGRSDVSGCLSALGFRARLQGASISAGSDGEFADLRGEALELGVSHACKAGELQAPPFSWREDNHDVLKCLV